MKVRVDIWVKKMSNKEDHCLLPVFYRQLMVSFNHDGGGPVVPTDDIFSHLIGRLFNKIKISIKVDCHQ